MIECDRVARVHRQGAGAVVSLHEVSLRIEPGTYVTIVGPSGSGKTSLLQILGTLDTPSSGQVRFHGLDLGRLSDRQLTRIRRREIGFVFQDSNLVASLNAIENVALPSLLDGVPRRQALARASALLERFGLSHRVRHAPHELSGGEKQRVAIARALSMEPRLILCDEPTGRLDSVASREVRQFLRERVVGGDRTLVVVTHDPEMAADADRMIRIHDGRIAADQLLRRDHARHAPLARGA